MSSDRPPLSLSLSLSLPPSLSLAGCFFSAAFQNMSQAMALLIPFDYLLMITGGIFINLRSESDRIHLRRMLNGIKGHAINGIV